MEENKKTNMSFGFIVCACLFLILTIINILTSKETFKKSKELFTSTFFIVSITIVSIFSAYILKLKVSKEGDEVDKLQLAAKHGILGILIAMLAKIDLVIAPFWLIFIASYYLNMG
tara:strand:- start:247 stop:594 length:348 start_codon:yes stop_codon:yes gene_type:complete